jgi:hypothetical protein
MNEKHKMTLDELRCKCGCSCAASKGWRDSQEVRDLMELYKTGKYPFGLPANADVECAKSSSCDFKRRKWWLWCGYNQNCTAQYVGLDDTVFA